MQTLTLALKYRSDDYCVVNKVGLLRELVVGLSCFIIFSQFLILGLFKV